MEIFLLWAKTAESNFSNLYQYMNQPNLLLYYFNVASKPCYIAPEYEHTLLYTKPLNHFQVKLNLSNKARKAQSLNTDQSGVNWDSSMLQSKQRLLY